MRGNRIMHNHNFSFFNSSFPSLELLGGKAEEYVFTDPNASMIKSGMLCENIVNLIRSMNHLPPLAKDNDTFAGRTEQLYKNSLISGQQKRLIDEIRRIRNKAAHEGFESKQTAIQVLAVTFGIAQDFMSVFVDHNYKFSAFIAPVENVANKQNNTVVQANTIADKPDANEEKLIKADEEKAKKIPAQKCEDIKKLTIKAENQRPKSEAETRILIDSQLRAVGWEVDTENIRYSKGTRPQKGRNLAIAEWPTEKVTDKSSRGGFADYALFIGEKLYAFIEAKAEHRDVMSVMDDQCKDYATHVRKDDEMYILGTYGKYQVPFVFATNGRPYLKEYEQKSGIWFLDLRVVNSIPRAQRGWMSPMGLMEEFEGNDSSMKSLLREPYDLLSDPNGLNLRKYQIEAIEAVENSMAEGKDKILLAMATGTGKTRTILGLIYRVLKTKACKRILYLVDRNSLGEQTFDVFTDVKIEDSMSLNSIYSINKLKDIELEKETKVQVATVQSMVKRILYHESGESSFDMPGVNDFDMIIIDEAHRGYILDKEMTDDEVLYSNQLDYQSKYRSVVDYFTGIKVALTATPALHTTEIFGKPVYIYSYRQAVIDGNLVDYDAPYILKTKFNTEGIHYDKNETIGFYHRETSDSVVSFNLPDEVDFDVEDLNRNVISESFNRIVLEQVAKCIDPSSPDIEGKTLIYAVNDRHADLIVKILKEIYSAEGVDNDAIMKITGQIENGDQKKIQQFIRKFKTEKYPSIVVTVDLLTTGIDVPSITKLVFLRCVKSRILYDQMLGRATRKCDTIKKDHFEIYDAVGITDRFSKLSDMKPVVAKPSISFKTLYKKLIESTDDKEIKFYVEALLAKLQRKKSRMDDHALKLFKTIAGFSPDEFVDQVNKQKDEESRKEFFVKNDELFQKIEDIKNNDKPVFISEKQDSFIEKEQLYGEKYKKPEDYLEAFKKYINDNDENQSILTMICTRPSDLTRNDLITLLNKLEVEKFTKKQLVTALQKVRKSNAEISADIITIIRNVIMNEEFEDHKVKVERAFEKLYLAHPELEKKQKNWLERFKKYLLNDEESMLNKNSVNDDSRFRAEGGFARIDHVIFYDQLECYFNELNQYLFYDNRLRA